MKVQIALISLAAVLVTCLPPLARADHQVTRWYGGRGAAISVTFDDGLGSQVTVGAPLLNARGLKGTFYVMSDPGWNAWPTYWEDWAVVAAAGHEIGSHTISHAHLATLTETEIRTELRESRRTIELMIDQPLGMTIAYPFGETTPQVEALTSEYYIAGRDVWSPGYMNYYSDDSADPVDFYAIGSYAFDYPEITTYETLAAFVDTAQATQAWFIPHIHSLETAQAQGVLAAFLDDLAGRENLWVDTLGSVVRYMRERSAATLTATESKEAITLMLTHDLDSEIYNHLLTVRSTVPASWSGVTVTQGGFVQQLEPMVEGSEFVVYYDVLPNGGAVFLTPGAIDNLPPDVDAGTDQQIVLPDNTLFLDGTVVDDGLPDPPGQVVVAWTQVSGPGPVLFDAPHALDCVATLPLPGSYVLRLTADDGEWLVSDDIAIQFEESVPAVTVEAVVATSSDDAEEGGSGTIYLNSSDLELVHDSYANAGNQTVGLRFANLAIPSGASVIGAYVQFKVDEVTGDAALLEIVGQAADNAPTFLATSGNISSRPTTNASVAWGPLPWTVTSQSGLAQRSPDLAAIIQEVVDRPGWNSGQALVLLITGSGRRTAESRDGDAAGAPRLVVEYTLGPAPNKAPVTQAGADVTLVLPQASTPLSGTASDDGQPGPLTVTWMQVAGPAGVQIQNPSALNTQATFPGVGSYALRLTASDGELEAFDDLVVEVLEEPSGITTVSVAVASSNDDAEEAINQQVYLDSSDLELVYDAYNNAGNQTVGMRFAGMAIPQGATIVNAWLQFQVDETGVDGCVLTLHGQAADNAPPFAATAGNITSRPLTVAAAHWTPDGWPVANVAGVSQQVPGLAAIVQEIIDRPNWSSGNALVMVVSGSGKRVAESFDGSQNGAPRLVVEFGVGSAVNKPPVVDAGPDQQLTLPVDSVWLAGAVTDDGLPQNPGQVTVTWSQVSGPGVVSFVDAHAPATSALFPQPGSYVLQLTASDGESVTGDQMAVEVFAGGGGVEIMEVAVASSLDDGEESSAGLPYLDSSDLELVYDGWDSAGNQTVGLRFAGLPVPQGASISAAYVQFKVDETGAGGCSLTIRGQAADVAFPFQSSTNNLSSRTMTAASVAWDPPPWNTVGLAGPDQRTPDLAAVVQEVVSRPGWTSGSALVILMTGNGTRTAESYDGDPSGAPLLHVEYSF